MATLMAVDGTNLLHRSYHALESTQMRSKSGTALWAVHGIIGAIAKHMDAVEPSSLVVAFDMAGGCPSRKALAPSYKQGRSATPAELTEQLILARSVIEAMGICVAEVQDWEADDVLATAATQAGAAGARCVIVSSDKDAHQLISQRTQVYKPEGVWLDWAGVMDKYGIEASRWVEYAALLGEGADNLSGVNGIGPKRAVALLTAFSDIEDAIADPKKAAEVTSAKVAQCLLDGVEGFRRNRQVGTLRRDLEVDLSSVHLKHVDLDQVREVAVAFELPQAGSRLSGAIGRVLR